MKVLVTGGAGYVGSRVVAHLLEAGEDVTVFDALLYGGEALLSVLDHPRFRLIQGDVRDAHALSAALTGQDAVVHLAAIVGEPACNVDEGLAQAINQDAAIALLPLAEQAGISRLVFLSTCSNYGIASADTLADEESPMNPLSLYARTKVAVEQAVLAHRGKMATTVLRLGTICGMAGRMRFDLLISELARAAVRDEVIEIYKPLAWRPFLHISDSARAIRAVLAADPAVIRNQAFNVVAENLRKRDLADMVLRHYPASRIEVTDRAPDNRDYRVSGERVRRVLDFHTRFTVEDAFLQTAEAVRQGVFRDPWSPDHGAIPASGKFSLA